jgi:hypothetical protein
MNEALKTQLNTLVNQRRTHEKAAANIRRQELKVRKAMAAVASLGIPTQAS